MKLDSRDQTLLRLLQADSRVSNADLAEQVGMSASACWRRVRALEEAGIITHYGAVVDPKAAGLRFQAIVHVQLARHSEADLEAFIRAVSVRAEVVECYATTGQSDYQMRVLCRDIDAYNAFLEGFLFRLPAVASAQTNVVLREIKANRGVTP
ncbi:Lrp/AsnC family transcriptional regulator [uncultured Tateyamaria sp.]|uniref:Lrp/AsnC family transcriptional regulator n=1 Tax=uncultured Tateyamaria sp. TaxID=455651 RepID=UPI00263959E4|nr:Lrp/AsnC family transcriptional regulator [uncultured Tateyamaria sp.]